MFITLFQTLPILPLHLTLLLPNNAQVVHPSGLNLVQQIVLFTAAVKRHVSNA